MIPDLFDLFIKRVKRTVENQNEVADHLFHSAAKALLEFIDSVIFGILFEHAGDAVEVVAVHIVFRAPFQHIPLDGIGTEVIAVLLFGSAEIIHAFIVIDREQRAGKLDLLAMLSAQLIGFRLLLRVDFQRLLIDLLLLEEFAAARGFGKLCLDFGFLRVERCLLLLQRLKQMGRTD